MQPTIQLKPLAAHIAQHSHNSLDTPCIIDTKAVTSWTQEPERDLLADMKAMIPTLMEEAEAHNQRVAELRDALLRAMMPPAAFEDFMRANKGNMVMAELFTTKPIGPPKVELPWP